MELFKQYSFFDIINFLILFALAIKGSFSFVEWASMKVRKIIRKIDQPEKIKYGLKEQVEEINNIKSQLKLLILKMDTLIDSDKDDIKAFITRQHHYFVYNKKWIDDYSLDCIQKRYSHYVKQGGNSFIEGLVEEIRKLPKKQSEASLKN